MAGTKPPLRKLVALKRQRAEQVLLTVQSELVSLNRELASREASLAALDGGDDGLEARLLAHRNGHARRLIIEIRDCRERIVQKERDLLQARENLKRVFDSEERLRRQSL
jgi:hypothetical protein